MDKSCYEHTLSQRWAVGFTEPPPLKHPSQSQPKKHAGEGTSSKGFLPGAEIQPREGVLLYPVRRFVVWSGDLGEVTSPFGVSVC